MKTIINTLILSGGGMKGVAYSGVLKYLEKIQKEELYKDTIEIDIKTVCSVSVGCLVGLLHVLKYSAQEIEDEILNKNFKTLKDLEAMNLFTNFGIDTGKNIMAWIESQILKRNLPPTITFSELYKWSNMEFKIIVTNLSKHKIEVHDYINTPELEVLNSIRMSISLPFFYKSVRFNNCVYVDGGIINNYPINLFPENDGVLGCNLIASTEKEEINDITTFDSYIYNLIGCIWNQSTILTEKEKEKTIIIDTLDQSTLNFLLTRSEKRKLMNIGYTSTEKYFEKFNISK